MILFSLTQELRNLKIIDLSHSYKLIELPDLSEAPNLESIYLTNCKNFCHLPALTNQKLVELYLHGCQGIKGLGCRTSLRSLNSDIMEEHDH